MVEQFKNKYLCKYFKDGTDKKFEIWHLGTINTVNPKSNYYKTEVMNEYTEYQRLKDFGNFRDSEIITDGKCYYLLVDCAGTRYASRIFWEKMEEIY